jgi:hypothetical protein
MIDEHGEEMNTVMLCFWVFQFYTHDMMMNCISIDMKMGP